jgi:L,D-peptidoglycan transpeptidase YkuD (ErfK/YbiS/YcfS/YnhG family)
MPRAMHFPTLTGDEGRKNGQIPQPSHDISLRIAGCGRTRLAQSVVLPFVGATMLIRLLCSIMLPLCSVHAFELPRDASQCLVGIADHWNSSHVTLGYYEKSNGRWQQVGTPWPARLGRNGLAWGRGLHPQPKGAATKKEGDLRAPAGVFEIGGAWGYDTAIRKHPRLPYRQITPRDLWVEDPASPHYNLHLVLEHQPATPWQKKQQMRQGDYAHSLKLFIAHNAPPAVTPNEGSAIFFHIWRDGGNRPSVGCTTMDEKNLRELIARIDPSRRPLYVLLTKPDYEKLRHSWKLP